MTTIEKTVLENLMMNEEFGRKVLPYIKDAHEQDGEVDIPARREGWSNFIDSLNKNGEISDYEAANIDADVESL